MGMVSGSDLTHFMICLVFPFPPDGWEMPLQRLVKERFLLQELQLLEIK